MKTSENYSQRNFKNNLKQIKQKLRWNLRNGFVFMFTKLHAFLFTTDLLSIVLKRSQYTSTVIDFRKASILGII